MRLLARLAVAAVLLAGASATADPSETISEAVELARTIQPDTRSMTEKIPRVCRLLRRAARESEAASDDERIDAAREHCRRAMDALNNGNPDHAAQRLRRLIRAVGE